MRNQIQHSVTVLFCLITLVGAIGCRKDNQPASARVGLDDRDKSATDEVKSWPLQEQRIRIPVKMMQSQFRVPLSNGKHDLAHWQSPNNNADFKVDLQIRAEPDKLGVSMTAHKIGEYTVDILVGQDLVQRFIFEVAPYDIISHTGKAERHSSLVDQLESAQINGMGVPTLYAIWRSDAVEGALDEIDFFGQSGDQDAMRTHHLNKPALLLSKAPAAGHTDAFKGEVFFQERMRYQFLDMFDDKKAQGGQRYVYLVTPKDSDSLLNVAIRSMEEIKPSWDKSLHRNQVVFHTHKGRKLALKKARDFEQHAQSLCREMNTYESFPSPALGTYLGFVGKISALVETGQRLCSENFTLVMAQGEPVIQADAQGVPHFMLNPRPKFDKDEVRFLLEGLNTLHKGGYGFAKNPIQPEDFVYYDGHLRFISAKVIPFSEMRGGTGTITDLQHMQVDLRYFAQAMIVLGSLENPDIRPEWHQEYYQKGKMTTDSTSIGKLIKRMEGSTDLLDKVLAEMTKGRAGTKSTEDFLNDLR